MSVIPGRVPIRISVSPNQPIISILQWQLRLQVGTYTVHLEVEDTKGNIVADDFTVTVAAVPVFTAVPASPQTAKVGTTVNLSATVNPGTATVNWIPEVRYREHKPAVRLCPDYGRKIYGCRGLYLQSGGGPRHL